ncbi:MAG: FAD-dependent oxidoreductase [Lachnospiraceae bacterium]
MIRLTQVTIGVSHREEALKAKCCTLLKIKPEQINALHIVKRSIDARKKPDILYSYVIDVDVINEEQVLKKSKCKQASIVEKKVYQFPFTASKEENKRIIIVGSGPAGLFGGYYLAMHGYMPIVLERGEDIDARTKTVEHFWETGELNLESNVQFGEGGAGTFSDGKLNTLVKDKDGKNHAVLKTFVEHGADEEILYDNKPHIGTDVLTDVIRSMRNTLIMHGGSVQFKTKVASLVLEDDQVKGVVLSDGRKLEADYVVLALGHSARDTFEELYEQGIPIEAKEFAVGFRVEHPQSLINHSQYGVELHEVLEAAPYKVVAKTSTGRGAYSFCMCPGGYVVNASSELHKTAVNGMSYSKRDGDNANSAIIVSVTKEDFGSDHPLAGIAFQRELEERTYQLGAGEVPVQSYGDFKKSLVEHGNIDMKYLDTNKTSFGESFIPNIKGKYVCADLTNILTDTMNQAFVEGMEHFGKLIPGFNANGVWLDGVESRTSSPIRIPRDAQLESQIKGLYPCGEGAGYAGGITSAAMDGIRVAEEIARSLEEEKA